LISLAPAFLAFLRKIEKTLSTRSCCVSLTKSSYFKLEHRFVCPSSLGKSFHALLYFWLHPVVNSLSLNFHDNVDRWVATSLGSGLKVGTFLLLTFHVLLIRAGDVYIGSSIKNLTLRILSSSFIFCRGALVFVRSHYRITWSYIYTSSPDIFAFRYRRYSLVLSAFNNSSNCFFTSSAAVFANRCRLSLGEFCPFRICFAESYGSYPGNCYSFCRKLR
jgi:hypothetical protein